MKQLVKPFKENAEVSSVQGYCESSYECGRGGVACSGTYSCGWGSRSGTDSEDEILL